MLTVATYFWAPDEGSKFNNPYTADDVRRLQRMVAKNLTVPHEFAVITDRPHLFDGDKAIRAIPIDKTKHVPGTCFVRLMTFHPKGLIGERVMQIDLDTFVVGNMDHLAARTEDLIMWRNPTRVPWVPGDYPAGAGIEMANGKPVYFVNQNRCLYNTSFLIHQSGSMPELWEGFDPRWPSAKDDQWYLSRVLGTDCPYVDGSHGVYRLARDDTPGSGVSGELPGNACIVTFPGSNGKPSDPVIRAANPWIEQYAVV